MAVAPNRSVLIVTGSEDLPGLTKMSELAEEVYQAPRPMSLAPVILDGSQWRAFKPTPEHPAFVAMTRMRLLSKMAEYDEQKGLLEKALEKERVDIFVASFTVVQDKGSGLLRSICVWSQGAPAYLPKSDQIMFVGMGPDGKADISRGPVEWDRVHKELASEIRPVAELYPARYEVNTFPSPEQFAALGL